MVLSAFRNDCQRRGIQNLIEKKSKYLSHTISFHSDTYMIHLSLNTGTKERKLNK